MPVSVPGPPQFGEPIPIAPSPPVLEFLARRRSASAVTLRAPGPTAEDISVLLRLATRVPDHGKLAPWRFIVLEGAAKQGVAERLAEIAAGRPDATKTLAALAKFRTPPVAVCVVSRTTLGDIPEWEQVLSAGAVCMSLLNAAQAAGFGANWITDWYAYDAVAKAALGVGETERVAGFVYMGTPAEPPLERVRPNVAGLITKP